MAAYEKRAGFFRPGVCTPMSAIADSPSAPSASTAQSALNKPMDMRFLLVFLAIIAAGMFFMAYSIYGDVTAAGDTPRTASAWPC